MSARQTNFGWARFWLMVVGDEIVLRIGSEFAWQKKLHSETGRRSSGERSSTTRALVGLLRWCTAGVHDRSCC